MLPPFWGCSDRSESSISKELGKTAEEEGAELTPPRRRHQTSESAGERSEDGPNKADRSNAGFTQSAKSYVQLPRHARNTWRLSIADIILFSHLQARCVVGAWERGGRTCQFKLSLPV